MSRPITAYEANLDNKDRREEWMEKRWPELCEEMAKAAVSEIDKGREPVDAAEVTIQDMLEANDALAVLCYRAETREGEQ